MVVPAVLGLLRMSHNGSAFFVLRHILHFNYNGLNPTWGHPASCLLWQSLRSRKLGADVCLSNDGHVWQVLSPHSTHPIFGFFKETPKLSLSQAGGWKRELLFLWKDEWIPKEASRWGSSVENREGASLEGLSFTHRLCTFGVLFPFAAKDLALSEVSLHLVTEENCWGLRAFAFISSFSWSCLRGLIALMGFTPHGALSLLEHYTLIPGQCDAWNQFIWISLPL